MDLIEGSPRRLPGIFEYTPFTRPPVMPLSRYIRAMHPKTQLKPTRETVERMLGRGWIGQTKIHGHRAQFHVPADPKLPIIAYARAGHAHKKKLEPEIEAELRRLFSPAKGWNVIDAEWLKPEGKVFVFDLLKYEDKLLARLTYPERWKLLPRAFISPSVSVLPMLTTIEKCLAVLGDQSEHIEGLVFKAPNTRGFSDTSIVRVRR